MTIRSEQHSHYIDVCMMVYGVDEDINLPIRSEQHSHYIDVCMMVYGVDENTNLPIRSDRRLYDGVWCRYITCPLDLNNIHTI